MSDASDASEDPVTVFPSIEVRGALPPTGSTSAAGSLRVHVVDRIDRPVTVVVDGELLQETAQQFVDATERLTAPPGPSTVLVDLSRTAFMDSTGLGALVSLHNRLRANAGRLLVVRPHERVFRLFEITRLDTLFHFVDAAD